MKKKKTPLPLKPLPNVPFLFRQPSSSPSFTHSSVRSSQSSLRRMQYFTDFSKQQQQQKKKNSRGFTPLFKIKKLLLHWLDFPNREISTATTFCVRKLSTAVGPVWVHRLPDRREHGSPERVSAHQRALLKCFIEKNRRGICLLVKFTIQSSESVRMTRQLG